MWRSNLCSWGKCSISWGWLINSQEELKCIVEWLLNTIDTIDTVCINDGYLRNQFSFATDELKELITKMLDEITISIITQ